jgi:hypothetical protein
VSVAVTPGAGRLSRLLPATLAIVALAALTLLGALPIDRQWWRALQDSCHGPVFGAIALLVWWALAPFRMRTAWRVAIAFGIAATLGLATELAQIPGLRDASLGDFANDLLGALAVLALAVRHRLRDAGRHPAWRPALLAVALLAFAGLSVPLARTALAYQVRDAKFPVLAQFATASDSFFVYGNESFRTLGPLPAEFARPGDQQSYHVVFASGPWPGISIDELYPDWRGYSRLVLDVTNPAALPLELVLRIHDGQHDQSFSDRYNGELQLPPRTRMEIRIDLDEVSAAPQDRPMDMRDIRHLGLFSDTDAGPREFYLTRAWLE